MPGRSEDHPGARGGQASPHVDDLRPRRHGLSAEPDELYFWRTQDGAELDLLRVRGHRRIGFEIKRTTSPKMTASMHRALADLRLDRLYVIHAGSHRFALRKGVEAVPWTAIPELARSLT